MTTAQQILGEIERGLQKKHNSEQQICELIKKANPELFRYLNKTGGKNGRT